MMMGKKKKSRATKVEVEHRAPHGMPEEAFVRQEVQEPLMPVPPLMTPVEMFQQPSMVETVQMVPQPTMVETVQMAPALVGTAAPVVPASFSYGGVMPATTSYGGPMQTNPSYIVGSTLPGGLL